MKYLIDKGFMGISTKFLALSGHHLMAQSNWNNYKDTKELQWGSKEDSTHNERHTKGQLISKCPFGVFKSTKKPTKFL